MQSTEDKIRWSQLHTDKDLQREGLLTTIGFGMHHPLYQTSL